MNPGYRRMRKVELPKGFDLIPHDSRYYAVLHDGSLLCITAYKAGALAVIAKIHELETKVELLKTIMEVTKNESLKPASNKDF